MQQRYHLSALPALLASARDAGRPARLSVRNTDGFGLIHLYFRDRRLVQVAGSRGAGSINLAELATWSHGTIRMDELDIAPATEDVIALLEDALASSLRELERRGVLLSQPGISAPTQALPGPASSGTFPKSPSQLPEQSSQVPPGVVGLPPLPIAAPDAPAVARPSWPQSTSGQHADDRIDPSQWRLLTMALHQVLLRAAQELGDEVAGGLLWQALAHTSAKKPFLRGVELDLAGWVQLKDDSLLEPYSRFDVVDAIATLLTEYETRCITLIGPVRARRIVLDGTDQMRGSLSQLGLELAPM